jgi:hypothetical protein
MTINLADLTTGQLHRIIAIKKKMEKLQSRIDSITVDSDFPVPMVAAKSRRRRSPAVRAKMAAATRARWAKIKGKAKKGKKRLSAAGRAAIIAGTKARWAKVRAAKKKDRRSSPAVRAKLAAAARARWAKVKAAGKKKL